MKTVQLDCRNFKCPNNVRGDCTQEGITLTPCGPITDKLTCGKLTCVEAHEPEEEKVTMVGGVARRDEGADPSSR